MRNSLGISLIVMVVAITGCANSKEVDVEPLGEVQSINQVSDAFTRVTSQNCGPTPLVMDTYEQLACDRSSIVIKAKDTESLERIKMELLINRPDFNRVLSGENWLIETSANNASALQKELGGEIHG